MSRDVRVLIMDEPTAALSAHEVQRLFRQVRRLTESGVAVLFVSHRLDEVFELSDRITVFRDGQHISTNADCRRHRGDADPRHGRPRARRLLPPHGSRSRRCRARASKDSVGEAHSTTSTSRCAKARCSASPASSARDAPRSPRRCSACWPADSGIVRRGDVAVEIDSPRDGDGSRHRLRVGGSAPPRPVAAAVRHDQHHAGRPATVRVSLATRRP